MHRKLSVFLIVAALVLPVHVWAVTQDDFEVKTTQQLINLCTASPKDELYTPAVNFCQGFLVGAYQYYLAENSGPEGQKLVCLPDSPPTRNEAIAMFLEWAKAHPEYMGEKPVETEFRFLMGKWPCKR